MHPPKAGDVLTVNVNLVVSLAPNFQLQLDRIEKAVTNLLPTMGELSVLREELRRSEEALRVAIKANTPK